MKPIPELLAARYPYFAALLTTRIRFTLAAVAILLLAVEISSYGATLIRSENMITPQGPVVGGDFIVLHEAGAAAINGGAEAIYTPTVLQEGLKRSFPGIKSVGVTFQYPPTAFLILAPFGALPYPLALALWIALGAGCFIAAARMISPAPLALLVVIAAPASYHAIVTGQTGFFTAALIAVAVLQADKRPLLAGLAAGLLTVKPQLGLLIPIAFAAAGCWRAFAVAAASALALAGASVIAFGVAPWTAFVGAVASHGAEMGEVIFPVNKLVTFYGAAAMLGAQSVGGAIQIAASLCLAAFVFFVWRRVDDRRLRYAVLASAALMTTPYAFYYELAVLLPAVVALAFYAAERN
ncbi:MAG: DUF2029 domain-containing protein, partial [Parvularculaceae bacterium]|nr:DUF2029 domain-containing protein [Parvularculaceae bacterium]